MNIRLFILLIWLIRYKEKVGDNMTYLSVIDKVKILFDMILDNRIIFISSLLIVLSSILCLLKVISRRKYMLFIFISLFGVLLSSIVMYYDVLCDTFDNFILIFFSNIYFPSIYVYIGILLISFIVFIVSMFNSLLKKSYRVINSVFFISNSFLFIVIINIIAKSRVDIFSQSLYSNVNLVSILEINVLLFLLWVGSLMVVFVTDVICDKLVCRRKSRVRVNTESSSGMEIFNSITSDIVPRNIVFDDDVVYDRESSFDKGSSSVILDSYDIVNIDTSVDTCVGVKVNTEVNTEVIEVNNDSFQDIVNDIENESIVICKPDRKKIAQDNLIINTASLEDLSRDEVCSDDTYSVNDYKMIIDMLKCIKNITRSDSISVDEAVSIGLINNYSVDDCIKFRKILESNFN